MREVRVQAGGGGAWGCLRKEPTDRLGPGLRLSPLARGSQKDPYSLLSQNVLSPSPFQVRGRKRTL